MDITFFFRAFFDAADNNGGINHRFGIGHTGYPGNAPGSGCHGPGDQVFLGFQARFPQMGVQVNKARGYHKARGIVDFVGVHINVGSRFLDFSVFNQQIQHCIQILAGIYKATILN